MRFNDLVVTWKYSFSLLAWKELKLLLLVSLNNFRRALKLTITNFWWLWLLLLSFFTSIFILAASNLTGNQLDTMAKSTLTFSTPFLLSIYIVCILGLYTTNLLLNFTYLLSTRTSVEAKDTSYYKKYFTQRFIRYTLLQLILAIIVTLAAPCITFIAKTLGFSAIFSFILSLVFLGFALLSNFIFLDFDNIKILHAIKKAFCLYFYFLPLFFMFIFFLLILGIVLLASLYLILILHPHYLVTIGLIIAAANLYMLIYTLLLYSCYATLYIKIKHAHPNLFFA